MDNYYSAVGAGIGTAYYLFILVFYIAVCDRYVEDV